MQSKKSHRSRKSATMFVVNIWQLPMGWYLQGYEFEFSWAPCYTAVISLTILLTWCFRQYCQHYTEWTCDVFIIYHPLSLCGCSKIFKSEENTENRWEKTFWQPNNTKNSLVLITYRDLNMGCSEQYSRDTKATFLQKGLAIYP